MARTRQSPGIDIREIDLTASIPAVGTSAAAFVGDFNWGPVMVRTRVSDDTEMARIFGKPTDRNYVSWYTGKNFLAYSTNLQLVRVVDGTAVNSVGGGTPFIVKNQQEYNSVIDTGNHDEAEFVAKYPGVKGDSIAVFIADQNNFEDWKYANEFDFAPGTSDYAESLGAAYDEVHVVVVDMYGNFTGIPGSILEKYSFLSKSRNAKGLDGDPLFYGSVISEQSQYVWWFGNPKASAYDDGKGTIKDATIEWGEELISSTGKAAKFKILKAQTTPKHDGYKKTLAGGLDGDIPTSGQLIAGWNEFKSTEEVDVGLLISGNGGGDTGYVIVVQHIIDEICERRKDCVVLISPLLKDVLNKEQSEATTNILKTHNKIGRSTSYGFMDSGWKLQYDVHNDKNRWVPLNADIAGLMAMTERDYDAWWSPAGFNRGKIKNVIALAFNPNEDSRTDLYKRCVNSVVTFLGEGTILYGDKTMLQKNSAFQFINVRRLFITLEKAIGKAAKYQLFEFNDEFTRAQFVSMVEPYLREVKGRRGVYDFFVKCDKFNNTDEVIDAGEFVGSIFVKPARSINYITLNFIAVRGGVSFTEVTGQTF